jgi:ABC-type uncharacterized transport system involved in gliding motility auxiliary subunit
MKFIGFLVGILALLSVGVAIVVQVSATSVYATSGAWATTGALFLAWFLMHRRMVVGFLTRKSTRTGANVALVVFLVLGILVFVNVIAKQHPLKKDLTRNGANTLSEQTVKVTEALTKDVTAHFYSVLQEKDHGEDVLKRFAYATRHFKWEYVDLDRNPTVAQANGVKRKNTVILSLEGTEKHVTVLDPTEEQITNGLIKLARQNEVTVYFLTGHEEHAFDSESDQLGFYQFHSEVEKAGYSVKELNLLTEGKVPADCAVLVVGGPKKAFVPKELDVLAAWLKSGGHLLFLADLSAEENGLVKGSREFAELLKPYGLTVMNQMLVDPLSQQAKLDPSLILGFATQNQNPITKDFPHSTRAANFIFPLTTYVKFDPKGGAIPLAVSSPQAWAESSWSSLKQGGATFDPASDVRGPLDVGVMFDAKKPGSGDRAPKIAVYGDSVFASNNMIDKVGNRDLVLNTVAWLADEDRFISIRAREDNDGLTKQFNPVAFSLILLLTIFVIPLALSGFGLFTWWRRSKL